MAGDLSAALERNRQQYGAMVREAYRNYRHNNYLTYLFASRSFVDVARKITMLREVAAMRERKLLEIDSLAREVADQKALLDTRHRALDSVLQRLTSQREKLQRDARSARSEASRLSKREKTALQQKMASEQELDVAISELRKLTRGNTEGASFSNKTTGLRLPVVGGRVKRYMENMAEITGPKGAAVISIYDGKVVEIKRNRITNKYDVFVAHGEYILLCQSRGGERRQGAEGVAQPAAGKHRLGDERGDDGARIQARLRHLSALAQHEDARPGLLPPLRRGGRSEGGTQEEHRRPERPHRS